MVKTPIKADKINHTAGGNNTSNSNNNDGDDDWKSVSVRKPTYFELLKLQVEEQQKIINKGSIEKISICDIIDKLIAFRRGDQK